MSTKVEVFLVQKEVLFFKIYIPGWVVKRGMNESKGVQEVLTGVIDWVLLNDPLSMDGVTTVH